MIRTLLRIALLTTAVGWGMGSFALVMSDDQVWPWLTSLAAGAEVPRNPAFAYWIRMLAACCGLIGGLAAWCAIDLDRQRALAWVLTAFQLGCGAALLAWGMRLDIGVAMWGIDVGFAVGTGIALAVLLMASRRPAGGARS
jgi:hypothetical protein